MESKNLPGEIVKYYESENFGKEEIKQIISKQKNELNEFIEKFNDLDKFIKDYKEEEIHLSKVREMIATNEKRVGDYNAKIKELQKENLFHLNQGDSFKTEIAKLQDYIANLRKEIERLENDIINLEAQQQNAKANYELKAKELEDFK